MNTATKKKRFIELEQVKDFIAEQSITVKAEYLAIVTRLEKRGMLEMPLAEKISQKNLFAIRVIHAGNVRVFYAYGRNDLIFGLYAYEKKTRTIPLKTMWQAEKTVKLLKQKGLV